MRRSGVCYHRLLRSCSSGRGVVAVVGGQRRWRQKPRQNEVSTADSRSDIEREADALARQLLDRHRQSCASKLRLTDTQKQEEWRAHASVGISHRICPLDALTGYGKTAMMVKLAHMCDVNEVDTRELIQTTEKEWDALTPYGRFSAAVVGASGRPAVRAVLRESRSNSSVHPPKTCRKALSPFDAVLHRYGTVVPDSGARPAAEASCSWRINMPSTLTRGSTVRGLLARKEARERHSEWQRVRKYQFPGDSHPEMERADEGTAPSKPSSSLFSSPVFRRYCLEFGSNTLGRAAFLTEPTTYYVLRNMRPTADGSLLEVRRKAQALSRHYDSVRLL